MARIEEVKRGEFIEGVRERPPYVPKLRNVERDTEEFLYPIAGELMHLIQEEANETPARNALFWTLAKHEFNNEAFDVLFGFAVDYFEFLYFQEKMSSREAIKRVVEDACAFTCANIIHRSRTMYDDADRETQKDVRDLLDDEERALDEIDRFKRRSRGGRDSRDDRDRDRGGRDRDRGSRGSYSREYDYDNRDRGGRGRDSRDDRDRGRNDRGRDVVRTTRSSRDTPATNWRTSPSALAEKEAVAARRDENFAPKIVQRAAMGEERKPPRVVQPEPVVATERPIGTPINGEVLFIQVLKENRQDWPKMPKYYVHPVWDGSKFLSYFSYNTNTGKSIPVFLNISECNMDFKAHDNEIWLTTRREEIRNRPVNYGKVDKRLQDAMEMQEIDRMLDTMRASSTVIESNTVISDVSVRVPRPITLSPATHDYHAPIDSYNSDMNVDIVTSVVSYTGVKFPNWGFADNDTIHAALRVIQSKSWDEAVSRLMRIKALLVPYYWEQLEYEITCRYNQLLMTGLGLLMTVDSFTEDQPTIEEMILTESPELMDVYQTTFFEKFKKIALTFDNTALAESAGAVYAEGERCISNVLVENILLLPLYSSDLALRGTSDFVALSRQSHSVLYGLLSQELEYMHDQSCYIKVVLLDCVEFYVYKSLVGGEIIYLSNKPIATKCLIDVVE